MTAAGERMWMMNENLIEGPIQPGQVRLKLATQSAEETPPETNADGAVLRHFTEQQVTKRRAALAKKLKLALKKHRQIGVDTEGFEVWEPKG